jgi:hypothetical protein
VLVVTVPWLLMLARRRAYTYLRVTVASLAAVASLAWIAERTSILATPVPAYVERIASRAPWILVGLVALTIGLEIAARVRWRRSRLRGAD